MKLQSPTVQFLIKLICGTFLLLLTASIYAQHSPAKKYNQDPLLYDTVSKKLQICLYTKTPKDAKLHHYNVR